MGLFSKRREQKELQEAKRRLAREIKLSDKITEEELQILCENLRSIAVSSPDKDYGMREIERKLTSDGIINAGELKICVLSLEARLLDFTPGSKERRELWAKLSDIQVDFEAEA